MNSWSLPTMAAVMFGYILVCAWLVFQPEKRKPPEGDEARGGSGPQSRRQPHR